MRSTTRTDRDQGTASAGRLSSGRSARFRVRESTRVAQSVASGTVPPHRYPASGVDGFLALQVSPASVTHTKLQRAAPRKRFLSCWRCLRVLALLSCLVLLAGAPGHAEPAIQSVAFFDDGQAHADLTAAQGPLFIGRALPFCPTDRVPCDEQDLAWVQMRISLDVY